MASNTSWYRQPRLQAAALFAFAFLLYANTLGHGFTLDDAIVITDNAIVKRGVAGWGELFTTDTFYGFFQDPDKANLVAGGRYRPLTLAMFALERQIAQGPFLHHLLNVIWYGILVVITFLFTRELVRGYRLPWWFAVAVAAVFAAHPIHTEAVANIKGRDEIIALLGSLSAGLMILRAEREKWFMGAVAGAVLLLLACLAKENAVTMLAVLPLMLFVFRDGGYKYVLPAVAAVFLFLLIRTSVIGFGLGEPVLELMNNPFLKLSNGSWVPMDTGERLATVFHTLWEYLRLLFVPVGLVHDYYPASIEPKAWTDLTPWLGLLLNAGLGIWAVLRLLKPRRENGEELHLMAFGMLFYLLTLSIVSNVFFSVGTFMSERFVFMPSFGFILALVGGISLLAEQYGGLRFVLVAIVAVFSILTFLRNPVWQDNYTLFTSDVVRQPNSAKLLNAAGGTRIDRYQRLDESVKANQRDLLVDARRDLTRALEVYPAYRNAYLLRGNAELLLKNYDAAIADYDRALEFDESYQAAIDNLIIALQNAGRAAGEEQNDLNAALRYLQRAQQLDANNYETLRLLGVANGVSGRNDQAIIYFKRAAELRPNNADAVRNYGTALYQSGREAEAQQQFERADQLEQ